MGIEEIASLLDRLGARFGLDALVRIEARESHIPERASVCLPVSEVRPDKNTVPGMTEGGASAKPPRPIRLFAPPQPIEAAFVLPDEPPFLFAWRHRAHRVACADGPERIAAEWWTAADAAAPDAIRDYYRIEDETGRRFWLFRAGFAGDPPPRWFLHGLFA